MSDRLYLSIAEAAKAIGISEDVIAQAIKAGDLVAFKPKVGGRVINRVRIEVDELHAWMHAGDAA